MHVLGMVLRAAPEAIPVHRARKASLSVVEKQTKIQRRKQCPLSLSPLLKMKVKVSLKYCDDVLCKVIWS